MLQEPHSSRLLEGTCEIGLWYGIGKRIFRLDSGEESRWATLVRVAKGLSRPKKLYFRVTRYRARYICLITFSVPVF